MKYSLLVAFSLLNSPAIDRSDQSQSQVIAAIAIGSAIDRNRSRSHSDRSQSQSQSQPIDCDRSLAIAIGRNRSRSQLLRFEHADLIDAMRGSETMRYSTQTNKRALWANEHKPCPSNWGTLVCLNKHRCRNSEVRARRARATANSDDTSP